MAEWARALDPMTGLSTPSRTVSVIVPTYNRGRYIEECLHSLLAQTTPPLEIIVVDDGSTDDTSQRVLRLPTPVRYVRKANGGKPLAVNTALAQARGDFVWILDDDDVALETAIENRLVALAARPEAGFVYAAHRLAQDGPEGRIVAGPLVPAPSFDDDRFFLEIAANCFFHLGTALVDRRLFLALGGLDPALRSGEDYDFQIRLARVAKPARCAEPVFLFRQHGGVRGASGVRYTAAQRSVVFRQDSRKLGTRLRETTSLGDYCVPPRLTESLTFDQRAEALLNRMRVMGNHGCTDELLADLASLLKVHQARGSKLSEAHIEAISGAMRAGWAYKSSREDWPRFERAARALRSLPNGRLALVGLARGLLQMARWPSTAAGQRWDQAYRAVRLMARTIV